MLKKVKPIYLILLFGLVLRTIGIKQSLWLDESISAIVAKNYSVSYIWNTFILSDTHPPLYYILLKIWTNIFGYSEVSLRLPSVLMGVATVYVIYLIAKKLFSENTGLVSALLLATSGLHIYYSQEVRMYSMTTFLVTLVVLTLLTKRWLALAIVLVLLAMTDYLPMTILLVLLGSLYFQKNSRKDLYPYLASLIPTAFFSVYWAKTFISQSQSTLSYLNNNGWWGSVLGESSIKALILVWIKFIIGRISFQNETFYTLTVILVSLLFGYTLIYALKDAKRWSFLWLWLVIPITLSFLLSLKVPGFSYFRLIFVLPAFYLLLSVGAGHVKWPKVIIGSLIGVNLLSSLLYLGNTKYHREDWQALVPFVENKLRSDEVVFVSFSEPVAPYLWYAQKKDQVVPFSMEVARTKRGIYTLDYLMDLTDPERKNYQVLNNLGFREVNIYNFRGTGQVRYWKRD